MSDVIESACPCHCHDRDGSKPDCAWFTASTCGVVIECQRCTAPDTEPAPPNYPEHPYGCQCSLCSEV